MSGVFFGRNVAVCRVYRVGLKALLQKRNAPSATGACPAAFTQLAGNSRLVNANIVDHFAFGYVKAVTEFVVEFQRVVFLAVNCA